MYFVLGDYNILSMILLKASAEPSEDCSGVEELADLRPAYHGFPCETIPFVYFEAQLAETILLL